MVLFIFIVIAALLGNVALPWLTHGIATVIKLFMHFLWFCL